MPKLKNPFKGAETKLKNSKIARVLEAKVLEKTVKMSHEVYKNFSEKLNGLKGHSDEITQYCKESQTILRKIQKNLNEDSKLADKEKSAKKDTDKQKIGKKRRELAAERSNLVENLTKKLSFVNTEKDSIVTDYTSLMGYKKNNPDLLS